MVTLNSFLSATSFSLSFRDPSGNSVGCDIQQFTHPGISGGGNGAQYATPRRTIPVPGDAYEFDPITFSMILDENLDTYCKIYEWIKLCIETVDEPQFRDKVSDLSLQIRSNMGNAVKTITYHNAFPTNLGAISFQANDNSDSYLTSDATFQYSHFSIK